MSKYVKNARVNLPGAIDIQAVIVDLTETVPGFPVYTLRWLDEGGETHTGTAGEGDLSDANSGIDLKLAASFPVDTMPGASSFEFKASRKRKPAKKSAAKRRR